MRFFDYEIEHRACYPWQFVQGKSCTLRLRCNEPVLKITVLHGDPFWFAEGKKKEPVLEETELVAKQILLDDTFYSVTIPLRTHKLRYHFVITLCDGTKLMLSELGVTDELPESQLRPFMVPYVFEREHYCAPDWAKNFVWYQIFPDRFAGEGDPVVFAPTRDNFFGGTLKGITGKIPYLKDLGVQGIYQNPIFQSPSNHRYDTADYAKIDSLLGDETDFRQLVESLHEAGLRIMLDGVFNHCAWGHPFWQDVLHKGASSPYYEWFYIEDVQALSGANKEKFSPEIIRREHPFACFAFAAYMPKWNTENEQVMKYLIGQAVCWTRDLGIDAWRLDVPDEISMRFLREFRRRIRAVSDQVYIIGEIWQDAGLWLDHAVFDGAMDYPLYYAIRDFAMTGQNDLTAFARRLQRWVLSAPEEVHPYQWAFCSNHDIPRLLTECGGDAERTKLALFLTAVLGGNMSVYYGDERGMEGGDDPDNRRAMVWGHCNQNIYEFYRQLIRLKTATLQELKLTRVIQREHLSLYLKTKNGRDLLAVIARPAENVLLTDASHFLTVFGQAESNDHGTTVNGFALFERKTADQMC